MPRRAAAPANPFWVISAASFGVGLSETRQLTAPGQAGGSGPVGSAYALRRLIVDDPGPTDEMPLRGSGGTGVAGLAAGEHAVHVHLGLEVLDVVNLRLGNAQGPQPGSVAQPFETLAGLQQEGLIRHLGVSKRHSGTGRRGTGDRADRVRAEHVQPGLPP